MSKLLRQASIYQELSKSGIVTLVLISVLGGYLMGHSFEHVFDPTQLFLTLIGMLLLASGSSALNQYQEREIDAHMPRTAQRPLPSQRITLFHARIFIFLTISAGLWLLFLLSSALGLLGVLALVSYNGLYTLWWKRRWSYAAIPGAIPGALPILMGYASANGKVFTPGGVYLFAILFFWQMPHFWVLALKYREDYAQGGFPTLPVTHGLGVTVSQIVSWCLAYIALALVAPLFLKVGVLYLILTLMISGKVLLELRAFVRAPESKRWLHFFLWVNFSLIFYLVALVADHWGFLLLGQL